MTSVLAHYRQKPSRSSYYVVTGSSDVSGMRFNGSGKPETVLYTVSTADSQSYFPAGLYDADGNLYTPVGVTLPSAGVLLKDLGTEIHVYTTGGASGSITSPNAKTSIWRGMAPVNVDSGLNEGAPGSGAPVVYYQVWSSNSSNLIGLARVG